MALHILVGMSFLIIKSVYWCLVLDLARIFTRHIDKAGAPVFLLSQ